MTKILYNLWASVAFLCGGGFFHLFCELGVCKRVESVMCPVGTYYFLWCVNTFPRVFLMLSLLVLCGLTRVRCDGVIWCVVVGLLCAMVVAVSGVCTLYDQFSIYSAF